MSTTDTPGAAVRPPRLYLAALVAGLALDYGLPLPVDIGAFTVRVLGAALVLAGAALMAWAIACFRHAGTNIPTVLPATTLVSAGPYRFSRNPIYVAMTAIYLGLALALASPWAALLLLAVLPVIQVGVIRREESYLEAKFGDAYRAYRSRVRRWF